MGITKCLDPTTTLLEKAHACLKPCYALTFFVYTWISEREDLYSKIELIAGSCCTIFWGALAALEGKKVLN
jgi:hypothetical protein